MSIRIKISLLLGIYLIFASTLVKADLLAINATNILTSDGYVRLQVFSNEKQFSGEEEAIAALMQKAVKGQLSLQIAIPPGNYAIRVLHDVNSNAEMDVNFVGMPQEPYGFSNNAKGNFGPPKWPDLIFSVAGDTVQNIRLDK